MALLCNLYIQSPNHDYSFILSPFSLHHSFTSSSRALPQSSHTVTPSHTCFTHSFHPVTRLCLQLRYIEHAQLRLSNISSNISRWWPTTSSNMHSNTTPTFPHSSLEDLTLHHLNINTDIIETSDTALNHPSTTQPLHLCTPPLLISIPSPVPRNIIRIKRCYSHHFSDLNKERMDAPNCLVVFGVLKRVFVG